MDEKLLFCVSINWRQKRLYGPEWKETEGGKTLIDLFLQVCGTDVLGQQVQVLVSKERAFLEAAVVQVYTPLIVLAEKSQSYIQFIMTTDNSKLEKHFETKKLSYGNSLGRNDTFSVKSTDTTINYNGSDEKSSYFGLASKPSFADMTVEEICEEIRRIKTTEFSKSTLDSLEDVKNKEEIEETTAPSTPPVIKRPLSRGFRTTVKTPPSLKSSLSPAQTRTSKLRSVNSAKRSSSCVERTSPKRPQTPKRSMSPSPLKRSGSPSPSKKSVSPSANERGISPSSSKKSLLPSPNSRKEPLTNLADSQTDSTSSDNISSPQLSSLKIDTSPSPTSKKIDKQRSPDLERLSALAQPRRRNSEPAKSTPVGKASSGPIRKASPSPIRKASPSLVRKASPSPMRKASPSPIRKASIRAAKSPRLSPRGSQHVSPCISSAKSRFVRPESNKKAETTKDSDYFVEFFTQNVALNSSVKESSFIEETKKSSETYEKYNAVKTIGDSLSMDSLSFNKANEILVVADVLDEIRNQSCASVSLEPPEDITGIREIKVINKTDSANDGDNHKKSEYAQEVMMPETLEDVSEKEQFEKTKKLHNLTKMDATLECEKVRKSPLFSPLLVKTQLRNSQNTNKMTPPEKTPQVEIKKSFTFPDSICTKPDSKPDFSQKSDKTLITNGTDCGHTMKSFSDNDSLLNLSEDIPIDSLSISSSSKNNDTRDHETSSEEQLWSNSRGIKFRGETKKPLNETFVLGDKSGSTSRSSLSAADDNSTQSSSSNVKTEGNLLKITSSPCLGAAASKTHERKHWGDSLQKMDELVIASLQAFSRELRSTSENVASNIRVLYERWRKNAEGVDSEEENDTTKLLTSKITPRPSPPSEDAGLQQNMAIIFRNLRKIEVKLKTMEQATLSMMKTEEKPPSITVPEVKEEKIEAKVVNERTLTNNSPMLNRSKSFKWKELKQTVRSQTKSSTWRKGHLQHEQETSSDSDTS